MVELFNENLVAYTFSFIGWQVKKTTGATNSFSARDKTFRCDSVDDSKLQLFGYIESWLSCEIVSCLVAETGTKILELSGTKPTVADLDKFAQFCNNQGETSQGKPKYGKISFSKHLFLSEFPFDDFSLFSF